MNTLAQSTRQNKIVPTSTSSSLLVQRKCACGGASKLGGQCSECEKKKLVGVQPKLRIGAANDIYEQEADRIAEQIIRMPTSVHIGEGKEKRHREVSSPMVQRKKSSQHSEESDASLNVNKVIGSTGASIDSSSLSFMENRFNHDFSQVRIHTGNEADRSARSLNAKAYTVGQHIVMANGQYVPSSSNGRRLLAHELTHTIQQQPSARQLMHSQPRTGFSFDAETTSVKKEKGAKPNISLQSPIQLSRACTDASICSPTGVSGSSASFGLAEDAVEAGPRARRLGMTPARAVSSGHSGHARQLELFLNNEAPGSLTNIHGVFIDADMSPGSNFTQDCDAWVQDSLPAGSPTPPGMVGASQGCIFVHGSQNREALEFNSGTGATIGGRSREEWRVEHLQLLIHENEHPRFESATAGLARPASVSSATCTRATIGQELSEIAAIMSEFPIVFSSASTETNPTGPMHNVLESWFDRNIFTGGESIQGALLQIGCSCECSEVDDFVSDTSSEVTTAGGWSLEEQNAFHGKLRTELIGPVRPVWPL